MRIACCAEATAAACWWLEEIDVQVTSAKGGASVLGLVLVNAEGLRMLLGVFRGGNPLERIVGVPFL
jgi:hypothetical protein